MTKIRPVILCGGSGTRLWKKEKNHQPKQFINFGNWTLLGKTLERIKSNIFDIPLISTNLKYLKEIKKHLKKHKIKDYKIILEPSKKNTAPAILSAALLKEIPVHQPLIFFSSDHLIEKSKIFNNSLKKNLKKLSKNNILIFGIKPNMPSDQYGYFLTDKRSTKVKRFIEKPNRIFANKIIKKGAFWNSGIFLMRKDSIIFNFKKNQKNTYKYCKLAVMKSKYKNKTYYLNKNLFNKATSKSFDHAILEKTNNINAIKLNVPWSDLGSWKEICLMYNKYKSEYFKKQNTFHRPWGSFTNLFYGKNFLIKELSIKPKGLLSLQKHYHRSEHWVVTQGKPLVTLNKKILQMKTNDTIYIPQGAIHRIQNPNNITVKIIEAQIGSILKETDIVRYEDIYGRVN